MKNKSEEFNKKPKAPIDPNKPIGLFDHIKHIRSIQRINYFNDLKESDKKSFNHFMILKALSMNPELLDDVSSLFRFFDKIPSLQFYQLLIQLIPKDKTYYPWIKSSGIKNNESLIELISKYFHLSKKEANEYINLLLGNEYGKLELVKLCENYGLTEKEINLIFKK